MIRKKGSIWWRRRRRRRRTGKKKGKELGFQTLFPGL
jgi:hypothetical protein